MPQLVETDDIHGRLPLPHDRQRRRTTALEEMAKAAKALGLKYLGLADHSQSLTVANGLSPERVRQQQAEIDALNKKFKGFHIFKGTECDILADGQLDYDDELLATFDYVVASVHSHFKQSREEMTDRIVRAVRNPHVTMLGHATGRLLLQARGLRGGSGSGAAGGGGGRHDGRDQRPSRPARHRLDSLQAGQGAGRADRHQPGRAQHRGAGAVPLRRGRGPPRLAEKADVFNTPPTGQIAAALAERKERAPGSEYLHSPPRLAECESAGLLVVLELLLHRLVEGFHLLAHLTLDLGVASLFLFQLLSRALSSLGVPPAATFAFSAATFASCTACALS